MLLNKGVDPFTQKTILPQSTFDETTTAHALIYGKGIVPTMSMMGYGLGWMRYSAQGHEVCLLKPCYQYA